MSDQAITLMILAVAVAVFVWNRIPVGIVALGVAVALWATGIVSLEEALAGFGSPTVVLIAALFVVAEGLDAAGITTWAGQQVIDRAGNSRMRLVVLVIGVVAILSALITPNGAVAALYPMVVVLAVRLDIPPSKLLMPVAFGAHAGALLVLTGSPVTILASEAAYEAGAGHFSFFEIALAGVPLLIGTTLVVLLFGERLLPTRTPRSLSRDLSRLPQALLEQYVHEEELARLQATPGSPLAGISVEHIDLGDHPDVHILNVLDARGHPQQDSRVSERGYVVVRGQADAIATFADAYALTAAPGLSDDDVTSGLVSRQYGVAEVIVTPRSQYIGERVFPGMVTDSGSLVVLAVLRHGEDLGTGELTLKAGDALLLQGGWDALDQHTVDPNVQLVDTPDAIRRQTVPLGPRAVQALGVLAAMVVLLTTGIVPAVIACLLAAVAMVLLRVVRVDQAHRAMNWPTIILVAGMIPLSTAISETGIAERVAGDIVDSIGGDSPYLLLLGLFAVTALLGQMISNTATALILFPIAVSVAAEMDVSPVTLLMCVNVAAAASLLTPVATPANTMVMEPGGYRFGDYWKLGLPVMGVYLVVSVLLVPLLWPL